MTPERVLLLRPDRAGDALKTLPSLRALLRLRPTWDWHVLSSSYNHSLLERETGIRAHCLPADWESSPEKAWIAATPVLPSRFDRAVSLLCDQRDAVDRLLAAIPASRRLAASGNASPAFERLCLDGGPAGREEAENIACLLEKACEIRLRSHTDWADTAPRLSPSDEEEAERALGPKSGRWLAACPLSSEPRQNHPPRRWARLLKAVAGDPTLDRIHVFAAPAERGRLEEIFQAAGSPEKAVLLTPSSFRALGAYLRRMDGVLGVDSGPAHLARALRVPTLSLLAGADAQRWFRPQGEGHQVLRRGRLGRFPSYFEMLLAFRRWRRETIPPSAAL